MLSIFIIVILKIAYDSFILNSYYNHGEELIYKIEKNKMESRVYPISLASNGIPIPQKIKRYKYIAIISTEVIGEAWYTKYNIQIPPPLFHLYSYNFQMVLLKRLFLQILEQIV